MLAGQKRGRHHHRHLLARHGRDEGGAHGDFGLAETDIAADQPVHRPALGQIGDGVGDGLFLILGLLIGKAGAEFVIKALGRIDRRQRFELAGGGDLDQLGGDLAHPLLHLGFALLPARPAQPVQGGGAFVGAIAGQKFDILHRQEQLAAVILDLQAVMRRPQCLDRLQAQIAADAMLDMGDQVAGRQRRGLGDKILGAALTRLGPHHAVAQHILFAHHREVLRLEAMLDAQTGDAHRARDRA